MTTQQPKSVPLSPKLVQAVKSVLADTHTPTASLTAYVYHTLYGAVATVQGIIQTQAILSRIYGADYKDCQLYIQPFLAHVNEQLQFVSQKLTKLADSLSKGRIDCQTLPLLLALRDIDGALSVYDAAQPNLVVKDRVLLMPIIMAQDRVLLMLIIMARLESIHKELKFFITDMDTALFGVCDHAFSELLKRPVYQGVSTTLTELLQTLSGVSAESRQQFMEQLAWEILEASPDHK